MSSQEQAESQAHRAKSPRMASFPSSSPPIWLSLGAGKAWHALSHASCDVPVLASAVQAGF
ncbi:MAG: hypothetical protein JKY27_04175, partial [Magnetovibrio sp.]|nr:hypothetical protein [Magnetovibrio sp.]